MAILRGEIYFVELGPTKGREADTKKRPVIVLSINDINTKDLVVTVIPGTTHKPSKKAHPTEVVVAPSTENGLSYPTLFQCFQIRAIAKQRFVDPAVGE